MNLPSDLEALILQLLAEHGEMFGLALVQASAGRLKRGTVYVTLGRMEAKGYVTSRAEARAEGEAGIPRRHYQASAEGARVLHAWRTVAAVLGPSKEMA